MLLLEAVAFILRHQIPSGASVFTDRFYHLLGLGSGDARVVQSLNHKEWPLDFVCVICRGNLPQELRHRRVTLVAVFHAAQVAAIVLGVLEKRQEV